MERGELEAWRWLYSFLRFECRCAFTWKCHWKCHPCVPAEKVLTQQPSCCINCTMNFQVSTSKGRIINHDLSKIFKTKHPSQSKQCILASWECEWRSVSNQILNCFSLFDAELLIMPRWFLWYHLSTARKIISTIHICHLRSMEHFLNTWAALGRCLQALWAHRCTTAGPGVGCQAGGLPQLPCQLRLLHPLLLSYSILDQCKIK